MKEDNGFSAGSVLLSFLLGGMVGAGLALLMAPQSGQETRRRIRELAEDVKGKASEYVEHTKERVSATVGKGKEMFEGQKSALAAAIEAGKEAYEKEVHK
jgi:gas vesicle protein